MVKETLKSLLDAAQGEGEVFEMIALSGGEITEDIENRLAAMAVALPAKVDAYYLFQQNLSARLETITKQITELTALKKSLSDVASRADNYLMFELKNRDMTEIKGNNHRFKITTCPKRTVVVDASQIPAKFKTVVTTENINKVAIKDAILSGETVPGAELEGGETLRCYRNLTAT